MSEWIARGYTKRLLLLLRDVPGRLHLLKLLLLHGVEWISSWILGELLEPMDLSGEGRG